jgi:hypothetical protein
VNHPETLECANALAEGAHLKVGIAASLGGRAETQSSGLLIRRCWVRPDLGQVSAHPLRANADRSPGAPLGPLSVTAR